MTQQKSKKNANRFVDISLQEMEQFMKGNFFAQAPRDKRHPQGELIYTFSWNDDNYMCKVFSSVTPARGQARPVGGDAIRVVLLVMDSNGYVPMWKAPRVYRTKNWRLNLQKRIDECLLRGKEGDDYECPFCGGPLILRDGKNGKFWACSTWSRTDCPYTSDFTE